MSACILTGDCRETLRSLSDGSVQCVVTSPPYWGLRDYGHDGQLGLEATPQEYVALIEERVQSPRERSKLAPASIAQPSLFGGAK